MKCHMLPRRMEEEVLDTMYERKTDYFGSSPIIPGAPFTKPDNIHPSEGLY